MPAITCTSVRQRNGRVYVRWSDKTETEFGSLQDARDFVLPLRNDVDLLKRLFVAAYLIRDPDGTNPAAIQGRTMTLDLDNTNLLQLLRITG